MQPRVIITGKELQNGMHENNVGGGLKKYKRLLSTSNPNSDILEVGEGEGGN